jgi:hypothetical protein
MTAVPKLKPPPKAVMPTSASVSVAGMSSVNAIGMGSPAGKVPVLTGKRGEADIADKVSGNDVLFKFGASKL